MWKFEFGDGLMVEDGIFYIIGDKFYLENFFYRLKTFYGDSIVIVV